jgi:hypothetical protein
MAALMSGGAGDNPALDGPLEPAAAESGISADPTMMSAAKRAVLLEGGGGVERWKEIYYCEKLELKAGEAPPLAGLRQAYFEGLNWVLQYYYRGVASWTWYYPYHYAPMVGLCVLSPVRPRALKRPVPTPETI